MTTLIRILRLADAPDITIPVRIHEPVAEPLDWSCRAEIGWPDGLWGRAVTGVDPIQALELALRMIGTQLYVSDLHRAGRLVWLDPGQGYGFPVPVTIRDMLIGEDRRRFG